MSSGTGANKTASEDSPSSEVKAADAANLIPFQGGSRSNHLPDGYQWCCSMLLSVFNESSCLWNGSQPKMKKGRLRVRVSLFILALVLVKASWLSSKGVSFHILIQDSYPVSDPLSPPGAQSANPPLILLQKTRLERHTGKFLQQSLQKSGRSGKPKNQTWDYPGN